MRCCKPCNNAKGATRGGCFCRDCRAAWVVADARRWIQPMTLNRREELIRLDPFYEAYLKDVEIIL